MEAEEEDDEKAVKDDDEEEEERPTKARRTTAASASASASASAKRKTPAGGKGDSVFAGVTFALSGTLSMVRVKFVALLAKYKGKCANTVNGSGECCVRVFFLSHLFLPSSIVLCCVQWTT